jgi:4-oxalocrotonate tautomerase family enzyme
MPTIHVHLLAGRSAGQKATFTQEVTRAAVTILGADKQAVRIEFHDVEAAHHEADPRAGHVDP